MCPAPCLYESLDDEKDSVFWSMALGEHLAIRLHFDLIDHKMCRFFLRAPSDMNFMRDALVVYAKVTLNRINVVYHASS